MLTISRQRTGLACILLLLCLVIALDFWIDRSRVREGLSVNERKAACETEADNWAGSTDFGTTEPDTVKHVKDLYVDQCEQVGSQKNMDEVYGISKSMNAMYHNNYAKQLIQFYKENAVNNLVASFLSLGAELATVQTPDKPDAKAVRNNAALLGYIDLIEKNSPGSGSGSRSVPSQPASEKPDSSSSSAFGF